jgi:hypothetical protein
LQRPGQALDARLETVAGLFERDLRQSNQPLPRSHWPEPLHDFIARERGHGRTHIGFRRSRPCEFDDDQCAAGEIDPERQTPGHHRDQTRGNEREREDHRRNVPSGEVEGPARCHRAATRSPVLLSRVA